MGPENRPESAPNALVAAALLVAVTAISFAAIFFRKAQPTHPLTSSAIRLVIATALLLPFTVRGWRRGTLTRRQLRTGAIGGVLYGLHFGSWVWSLGLTTVAASVTLVTATPLLLAIIALLTGRDRPTPRLWLSLCVALCGVLLIGGHDFGQGADALIGDGLALLGAAAMAGYLLLVRAEPGAIDVLAFSGVACGVGAMTLLLSALAAGVSLEPSSQEALLYLALAALIPQIVGHGLLTWSLKHTTPVAVGIATVGEPVGASVWGWLWLNEAVAPQVLTGCALTLTAVILALTGKRPKRRPSSEPR